MRRSGERIIIMASDLVGSDGYYVNEEWRPVPGQEGRYEVSDQGRFRSIDRVIIRSDGILRPLKGRIRKLQIHKTGYPCAMIRDNGKSVLLFVHRVVAAAFIGSRPEGKEVRHLDGDSGNARLSNLSYSTHQENQRDMILHGTACHGEKSPNSKLIERQVRTILTIGRTQSLTETAAQFGVCIQTVANVLTRKTWPHVE